MLGIFDRYLLVRTGRVDAAELGTDVIPKSNPDSFILDWSLDDEETANPGTDKVAANQRLIAS
jgi:hypothetical protein